MAADNGEQGQSPSVVSLGEYVRIARRRWLSMLVGLVVGVAAGVAWYVVAPRQYEARATVTINPITDDLFSTTPVNQLVNTATEAEVMRSIDIAERASVDSGLSADPRDMRRALTVTVPPSSLTLDAQYVADAPADAAVGANAFANAYLDYKNEIAEARRAAYVERLRAHLDELRTQFADLPARSDQRGALLNEIATVRLQLGDATALPISAGSIVTTALPPRFPSSPTRLTTVGSGLVLGLLLGLLLMAVRQARDDRLVTATQVERVTRQRVIGTLPAIRRSRSLSPRESDDVALVAKHLVSPHFGRGLRRWVFVRPDVGRPTRADVVAEHLSREASAVLVRSAHTDGQLPAPDVRVVPSVPEDASADEYVIVDGEGFLGLAEAIGVPGTQGIIVVVELGVTRARHLERVNAEMPRLVPDGPAGVVVIRRRRWRDRLPERLMRRRFGRDHHEAAPAARDAARRDRTALPGRAP